MGCGQSRDDVETGHIHIKTICKSKKSRELKQEKVENTQLIQKQEEKEETKIKNDLGNGDLSIEGLICDGISGKTEYFSPKRSNLSEEKGNGSNDLNEENEKIFSNRDLSIDQVICDGVSGKTEFYSPNREGENIHGEEKENGNENLSIEGVIWDGCSGKTEYYSPKKMRDDVEVEDKEVLVEEKTGEGKIGKKEEGVGDGDLEETEFCSIDKSKDEDLGEFYSIDKSNNEVEGNDFPSKEKESEMDTTIHVSGYAFDTLLSWWKTREI